MRRRDREITDKNEIFEIIGRSQVCHLGLSNDNVPYIVPMNFGFLIHNDEPILYFHCAGEGKKIDLIKRNPVVCIQFDGDHEITRGELACNWSMNYRSVVGMGLASMVTEVDEKITGLNAMMKQYSGQSDFEYDPKMLEMTTVFKVVITEITGKKKGY